MQKAAMKPKMMTQAEANKEEIETEMTNVWTGCGSFVRAIVKYNTSTWAKIVKKDIEPKFAMVYAHADREDVQHEEYRETIVYIDSLMEQIIALDSPGRKHRKDGYQTTVKDYLRQQRRRDADGDEMKIKVIDVMLEQFKWKPPPDL